MKTGGEAESFGAPAVASNEAACKFPTERSVAYRILAAIVRSGAFFAAAGGRVVSRSSSGPAWQPYPAEGY